MKKIFFEIIPSTNQYLKENYQEFDNLTLVYANHQTEGRGRLGRVWIDNDDLLFSILVKENLTRPTDYTFLAALTILNVLKKYEVYAKIKWPNDLMVRKKKICGILLEGISSDKVDAVVIGCGLNVNTTDFPKGLFFKTTSMKSEKNVSFDKEKLLDDIIIEFESLYKKYIKGKLDLIDQVRENMYLLNRVINFTFNGKQQIGVIKGIDDNII